MNIWKVDFKGIKWEYSKRAFINGDNNVVIAYNEKRPFTQEKHTLIVGDLFVAQDVLEIVNQKIQKKASEKAQYKIDLETIASY